MSDQPQLEKAAPALDERGAVDSNPAPAKKAPKKKPAKAAEPADRKPVNPAPGSIQARLARAFGK